VIRARSYTVDGRHCVIAPAIERSHPRVRVSRHFRTSNGLEAFRARVGLSRSNHEMLSFTGDAAAGPTKFHRDPPIRWSS